MSTEVLCKRPSQKQNVIFGDSLIKTAIDLAIKEDLGNGKHDITSAAIINPASIVSGYVVCKQPCIMAGLEIFSQVLSRYSGQIEVSWLIKDGTHIVQAPEAVVSSLARLSPFWRVNVLP